MINAMRIGARDIKIILLVLSVVFWVGLLIGVAFARDYGQWEATDADVSRWFRQLMQPDIPDVSCCGAADAWYADSFDVETDKATGEGRYVAIITDERDDAALGRRHIEPGTRVVVPNHKLKFDDGNPTGHGVIFLGSSGQVFCYIAPGGV